MNATANIHLLGVTAGDLSVRSDKVVTGAWISVEIGRSEDVHVDLSFVDADQARAFFSAGLAQLDALPDPGKGSAA